MVPPDTGDAAPPGSMPPAAYETRTRATPPGMGGRASAPHGGQRQAARPRIDSATHRPQRPPRGPGHRPPVTRHAPRRASVPPATMWIPFESVTTRGGTVPTGPQDRPCRPCAAKPGSPGGAGPIKPKPAGALRVTATGGTVTG